MKAPPFGCRRSTVTVVVAMVLLSAGVGHTHNYVGLESPLLFRARVQSPNATVTDFPVPIPGTSLSVMCFKVRNTSQFDSRITAIGLDLPGTLTGFTLISPIDTDFELVEQVGQVPQLHDVILDFALVTGRTFGGGQPHAGLPPSDTLTTFCVSGPFPPGTPIERLLDLGVLRMQAGGADSEEGDILVWDNRPR